jgi:stearoyl-CoA desaturase (delta-9 desaturase)
MKQSYALAHIFFYIFSIVAIPVLLTGWTPWLLVSFAIYFIVSNLFSVIYHRYYTHRAFEANENVMFKLAWFCALFFYPSVVSFVIGHTAHHSLSDTDDDTHVRGWRGFFIRNHKPPPTKYLRAGLKLLKMPKHKWMHDNVVNVQLIFLIAMLLILPLNIFLYVYVVPIFIAHLIGRLHVNFSHYNGQPCNRWYLEYILPFAGEWSHEYHHEDQTSSKFVQKWYELDTGYWFSRMLIRVSNRK